MSSSVGGRLEGVRRRVHAAARRAVDKLPWEGDLLARGGASGAHKPAALERPSGPPPAAPPGCMALL